MTRHSEVTLGDACRDAGQEGWELVTVVQHRDTKGLLVWTAFLKRPSSGAPTKAADEGTVRGSQTAGPGPTGKPTINPPGFDLSGDSFDVKSE
jgi:hypothetical protein